MKTDPNLPALDNNELRESNNKKIVEGLHEMGQYAKEMRKGAKISMYIGIGMTCLLILALVAAFYAGGIDGLIDLRQSKRSFDCTAQRYNDTVRSYADAENFINLYSGECYLKIKGEKHG